MKCNEMKKCVIKDLLEFNVCNPWFLEACVTYKSDIDKTNNGITIVCFSLSDKTGTIQCVAFGGNCFYFSKRLSIDKVYKISNATLNENKYNHKLNLIFQKIYTKCELIEKVIDIPQHKLLKIREIADHAEMDVGESKSFFKKL
jgi:hypothetical protein